MGAEAYQTRLQMDDTSNLQNRCKQETRLELGILEEGTVAKDDVLQSIRDVAFLCNLFKSIVGISNPRYGFKVLTSL